MGQKKYCTKCGIRLNDYNGNKCMICGGKLATALPDTIECPTCHSTNINRVSNTRRSLNAFAFGITNPTARAQFECKNCGYKW